MASRAPQTPRLFTTDDGLTLPVLDLTDPRFAVPTDDRSIARLRQRFDRDDRRRRIIPTVIQRALMARAARTSPLVKALLTPGASHYDGICTYVIKLGAENLLPPFTTAMDRRLTASAHATCARLRMQMMSQIMARAVIADDAFAGREALHLINIGGGPSFDSINALLMLRRDAPALLRRPIILHVLDRVDSGARLCAAAIASLTAAEGPLAGVQIDVRYLSYDWNQTEPLAALLGEIAASGGVALASSEGALFEYGEDAAIVGNLRAMAHAVRFVVGSVTADRATVASAWFDVKRRGIVGITPLVAAAGFRIVQYEESQMSYQVLLRADGWAQA